MGEMVTLSEDRCLEKTSMEDGQRCSMQNSRLIITNLSLSCPVKAMLKC